MEKGTPVFIYFVDSDVIRQYEFGQEYISTEKNWNPNYKERYVLKENGETVPFLFFKEQLHLTIQEAEAERKKWRKSFEDSFAKDGVLNTLFNGWSFNGDEPEPELARKVMRELIEKEFNKTVD